MQSTHNRPLQRKKKNAGWGPQEFKAEEIEISPEAVYLGICAVSKPLASMSQVYSVDMKRELGSGFASVVYLGKNVLSKQLICVKAVDFVCLKGMRERQFLKREIEFLGKLRSPHVISLLDVYESVSFCYLVMEYCPGGDLYRFIKSRPEQPAGLISRIAFQICLGLLQFKQKGVLHRDLKTQNIFLGNDFVVKIGDLGFSIAEGVKDEICNVGSPIYMAPEVLAHSIFSFESDIYGLGIIWYELLHKHAPWEADSQPQLLQAKLTTPLKFGREDIPPQDQSMIRRCLQFDPSKRCSIQELIDYFQKQEGAAEEKKQESLVEGASDGDK